MATTDYAPPARSTRSPAVNIAGTRWPLYKLEAVVAGLLTLVGAFALVGAVEPAVLTATFVALVVWWGRRAFLRRRA